MSLFCSQHLDEFFDGATTRTLLWQTVAEHFNRSALQLLPPSSYSDPGQQPSGPRPRPLIHVSPQQCLDHFRFIEFKYHRLLKKLLVDKELAEAGYTGYQEGRSGRKGRAGRSAVPSEFARTFKRLDALLGPRGCAQSKAAAVGFALARNPAFPSPSPSAVYIGVVHPGWRGRKACVTLRHDGGTEARGDRAAGQRPAILTSFRRNRTPTGFGSRTFRQPVQSVQTGHTGQAGGAQSTQMRGDRRRRSALLANSDVRRALERFAQLSEPSEPSEPSAAASRRRREQRDRQTQRLQAARATRDALRLALLAATRTGPVTPTVTTANAHK